jgi:hypothetical protein
LRKFLIGTLGRCNNGEFDVWGKRDVHTSCRWVNLKRRHFGRTGHKWEDNINMDFKEIE